LTQSKPSGIIRVQMYRLENRELIHEETFV